MQWYSYSRNSDFDKPRSIVHRCDEDCGGFEYEYCFAEYEYCFAEYEYRFAEYEYRVAEYDTNSKTQPVTSVSFTLALHVVRKTQTASVHPPHPATPSRPL